MLISTRSSKMDLTFIFSAVIFTLLAIVVATSIFNGSPVDFAMGCFGHTRAKAGLGKSVKTQNGHVCLPVPTKKKVVEDWSELSGSSHDHWDVVKSVEELHSHKEELATPVEHIQSSLSISRPASRNISLGIDTSGQAASGRGRRSFIGLSDKELLKCAFLCPQNEGAPESPWIHEKIKSKDEDTLKYVPGRMRNEQQQQMSKDELEEEQRVQREQLAAIFQLLKENQETFGEVSEGEIEKQLKLYSL